MALNAFLTLQGKAQGIIKGSVTQKGREGTILVYEAQHEVLMPTSGTGGAVVGKRVHKPFVITKELDRSSPLLYKAMVTNELITNWELKFYTSNSKTGAAGAGVEKLYYTVRLTDVIITDIKFSLPSTKNDETAKLSPFEEIAFTYRAIEWNWAEENLITTDQWQQV